MKVKNALVIRIISITLLAVDISSIDISSLKQQIIYFYKFVTYYRKNYYFHIMLIEITFPNNGIMV